MADFSFAKSTRLLNAGDYKATFDGSKYKVSCRFFLVLARPNALSRNRLGLVVAKKNVARASQRNRLKRLAREWFRHLPTWDPSLDMVVLVRKDADTMSNSQVTARLATLGDDLSTKLAARGRARSVSRQDPAQGES